MDKLTVINRALSASGNRKLATLGDGSPEWIAADNAFERALDYFCSIKIEAFSSKTVDLQRVGGSPRPPWLHAMQYPPDCFHLRTVFDAENGQPVSYDIVNNQILTKTDVGVRALYNTKPSVTSSWHGAAQEYITMAVEAELVRGLGGMVDEGLAMMRVAQDRLDKALGIIDQQIGPRQAKLSRVGSARRARKV